MPKAPFSFSPLSKDEIKRQQAEDASIKKSVEGAIEKAQRCFNMPEFQEYRVKYAAVRDEIIDVMVAHQPADPVSDAFFLRTCLAKLDVLKMIIDDIKKDARKKK